MSDVSRDIPETVQRELRQEVGFSCPAPSSNGPGRCGSPYLTWHHFDPPWNVEHHHDPKRMIALCQEHHKKADHGAYAKEQLYSLKERARNNLIEVKGRLDWMRNDLLAVVGSNFCYKTPTILQYCEDRIIWFERDEQGYLLLNIDLGAVSSKHRLLMRNNFWQVLDNPTDIECPPSGKKIRVKYKNGDNLMIEFYEIESEAKFQDRFHGRIQKEYQKLLSKFQKKHPNRHISIVELHPISLGSNISFPLVAVEVHITIKEANLRLGPNSSDLNNNTYVGCVLKNCSVACQLLDNGVTKLGIR